MGATESNRGKVPLRAVKITLGVSFVLYWLTTILYVSPDNYLKVRLAPVLAIFETIFYQKWEFFAPPPTFNLRAYAIASLSEPPSTITLDLMSELIKRKKDRMPFNGPEDALDYVLFGSVVAIDNNLREAFMDCKRSPERADKDCVEQATAQLHEWDDSDRSVLALRNYALSALPRHVPLSRVKALRLKIGKVITPKFGDAMLKRAASAPREITIYETKEYAVSK